MSFFTMLRCLSVLSVLHVSWIGLASCQLDKVSTQVAPDASARLLRKESADQLASSLVEANISAHKRLSHPIPVALFKNKDFEHCTTHQFESGHIRETFELDAPETCPSSATNECMEWTCAGPSGSVRMVPSGHQEAANLAAKSGGVQMCLEQTGAKISQTVGDHVVGRDYKVAAWLIGFQGKVTSADGTVTPVHCTDKDPIDGLELTKHCCFAVDVDGVEKYRTEDILDTYDGEMVYYKATSATHTISLRHCGSQSDSVICIDDTSLIECGTDDAGDPACQE
jgi:hypothetical protein